MNNLSVLILGILTALLLSVPSHGKNVVIASSGEVAVSEQDVLLALAPIPQEKRASVVSNPKLMSQLIERILFNRIIASRAGAAHEATDEDPLVRDARLADIYLTQVTGSPPDFHRLATEQYVANPGQWRISAKKQVQILRVEGKVIGNKLAERYSADEFTELAAKLNATIKNLSVTLDRPQDFEPHFWETVHQLQTAGETKVFHEETEVLVVRLESLEQGRLRSREEAVPLIVEKLEADWKKAQADRIMAELQQLEVVVDGVAVIALRDRVLREAEAAQ